MKLSREVKTGIFAIFSIVIFIFGYNFLKGSELFDTSRVFYAKYENVAGLSPSAPVTVNGMQVGKVRDVYLATNRGGKVVVEFTIDEGFEFSKSSIIQIYSSGFIGGNNLGVLPDYSNDIMAKSGDTLQGQMQAGLIDGILEKFTPIEKSILATLKKLDTVLTDVNDVLDEKTKRNLQGSAEHLNETMASFNDVAMKLNGLMAANQLKLENTLNNLDTTMVNMAKFSDSLAQIEISKLVVELEGAISKFNAIAGEIEAGEGTIGKLLKDEKLYNNMEGAAKQMEQLLQDMKLNPKRYVHFSLFGKRPKDFEAPEE